MPRKSSRVTRRRAATGRKTSDEFLQDIEAVTLRLENGTQAHFVLTDELSIPSDPEELVKAAYSAPSRMAFWAYQTERALSRVRQLEAELRSAEGGDYITHRKYLIHGGATEMYDVHTEAIRVTDRMVQAHAECAATPKTDSVRDRLQATREQYGTLRAIREAMQQRCFLIDTLIKRLTAQRG